jgi:hypothetical protein
MATVKKPAKKMQMGGDTSMMKMGDTMAKNGKKFPDLNKDGKITKADILKGRGVIAKKGTKVKKAQGGDTLRGKDLEALAHQKRGMGQIDGRFVKKAGAIKNELGTLTPYQKKQLGEYMSKSGTAKKIYQALPNAGRMFGKSAADIPKDSKLQNQRKGGIIKKSMKSGGKMTKKCAYGCK